jgi:hypothetical protein
MLARVPGLAAIGIRARLFAARLAIVLELRGCAPVWVCRPGTKGILAENTVGSLGDTGGIYRIYIMKTSDSPGRSSGVVCF